MRMSTCHPDRKAHCGDTCDNCYRVARRRGIVVAKLPDMIPICHPDREYQGNGLCRACYLAEYKPIKNASRVARLEVLAGRSKPDACELCHTPGKIFWDHDHANGKFRGWLCRSCNLILGHVRDSANQLRALAHYVEHGGIGPGPTASRELNERETLEKQFPV